MSELPPLDPVQGAIAGLGDEDLRRLREQLTDLGDIYKAERENLLALIDNELAKRAGRLN